MYEEEAAIDDDDENDNNNSEDDHDDDDDTSSNTNQEQHRGEGYEEEAVAKLFSRKRPSIIHRIYCMSRIAQGSS